jgi:hypothetical protein
MKIFLKRLGFRNYMLSEIEGTVEEVSALLKKHEPENEPKVVHANPELNSYHWSETKNEWISIVDMDTRYIVNVVAKMLREDSVTNLMESKKFKSLVIALGERLKSGE